MAKATTKPKLRRTTTVPVTTLEEVPMLTESERAALLKSLADAEARIRTGKAIDYGQKTFKKRLLSIYRAGKKR
jgi:hypothetical protein